VKTQLIKEALIRSKLVLRANVSCVILYIHFQIYQIAHRTNVFQNRKFISARSLMNFISLIF